MEKRGMYLLLIFIIPSISGESLYYKVPKDHDPTKEIRGNSFGLENFLLQAYKEADTVNDNENVQVKRLREKQSYRKPEPASDRGQTYGLEMLTPNIYNFGHPAIDLSQYISQDFKPVIDLEQENSKRRIPEVQIHRQNDLNERRERNKIRKPVKQVVRRPVSTTKAPSTTTQRALEPKDFHLQNEEREQNQDQEALVNETVAEASYAVAKTQEIPVSDKDTDDSTNHRPRKRVTMRRRRKRPQSSQKTDNNTHTNDASSLTDGNEAYELQKELDYVPAHITPTTTTTSTTTTTINPRTDKERLSRRKPGGSKKTQMEDPDPTEDAVFKTEFITDQYRNDSDAYEVISPTIYTSEMSDDGEKPSEKPATTTTKSTTTSTTTTTTTTTTAASTTSSEETSATDLKTFLKQQNGHLSLSELLQTQNLSLSEFLKNRKEAALILSGRRGVQSTSPRPDSRERRPNFIKKNKSFSRHRQETDNDDDESRSAEKNKSLEVTTLPTDKYSYNGFVPKKPRNRYSQGNEHSTNTPYYGSEEKSTERRLFTKVPDRHGIEQLSKRVDTTETLNQTRGEVRNIPKRFNDMRLKLRVHRRKYNPHSTTRGIEKDEKTVTSTIATTTSSTSSTQMIREKPPTTEEITTTKRIGLRIPFKSSNNPELSLILPSKNKTEEKSEKRERYSSYASRVHSIKKPNQEKDDLKGTNLEQSTTMKSNDNVKSTASFPLDAIDFDDEKELLRETQIKPVDTLNDEKDKGSENNRVDAVGKIPLPNEVPKYEQKDEILELLKPGSTSERLQRILESRNMTVKELLENREKSSQHANFTQLFQENDIHSKRNDLRTTTTTDTNFKVFQSLPDFEPIHRNLFQKNVKEVKSNSHADSEIEESQMKPIQAKINMSMIESRGSKQFNGVLEVKKKLQLNSDSESRDTSLENNDGVIDQWNKRDKYLFYNSAFPKQKEKIASESPTPIKFPVNERAENEIAETDIILLETIRRSQEENQKLKSNINEILQEQSEVRDLNSDIDKSFIPPAVKSAIIASGIVMGLALFVFVAIFAACGWKQRQIRLRARSSILNDALAKSDSGKKIQRTSTISPVNYNQSSMYKKTLEIDDQSSTSASLSSNASSYLWNTLKNTFTGRNTTLKNRLDKEDNIREERLEGLKSVLRSQENRRSDLLVEDDVNDECFSNSVRRQEGRYSLRKNDCVKSPSFTSSNHFNSCTHGH